MGSADKVDKKRKHEVSEDKKKHKKEKKSKSDIEKKDKKDKKNKMDKKDKKETKEKAAKKPKHSAAPTGDAASSTGYVQSEALTAIPQADIEAFLSTNEVTVDDPHHLNLRPILSFDQIDLNPKISEVINKFPTPTPIQSVSWPYLLSSKDVIGVAETGSGKTFAFGVPAINNIITLQKKGLNVLCISPTRELALQTYDNLVELTSTSNLSCVAIYGGVLKEDQKRQLKNANVVVATPGRLLDLLNDAALTLDLVDYLVLDEADRMLEKGFEQDIKSIIGQCKPKLDRQTLMFTATWPKEVRELAATFMNTPVKVSIGDRDELSANKRITQIVEVIEPYDKEQKLLQLLKKYQSGAHANDKVLIFALYKKEATRVEALLQRNRYSVAAIHGDLSQQQRTQALNAFKLGERSLLLATDVAARGLDIPNVKTVINLTFPLTVEDYVHRIGRTGRAGQTGTAHTLFTEHEKHLSGALMNILRGANQPVPDELLKFGGHTKKKAHSAYGAFFKDVDMTKTAKKIKFD